MGCTSSMPVDPAAEARSKEIDKMLKEVSRAKTLVQGCTWAECADQVGREAVESRGQIAAIGSWCFGQEYSVSLILLLRSLPQSVKLTRQVEADAHAAQQTIYTGRSGRLSVS
jgi:hypothetical protein